MKPHALLVIALGVVLSAVTAGAACAQTSEHDPARWDLRMIREAPVWQKLLVSYTDSDHRGAWPRRKAALQSVLDRHPDSRWADDAALLLACGRASLENDLSGAIGDLQAVVERYPDAQTVVDRWDLERGGLLDETWLIWQGGLVFLNEDGSLRTAKPFDQDGEIDALEREALAYFAHLEKYPRATAVMARLFQAEMEAYSGERAASIETLTGLVEQADAYLPPVVRADRTVGLDADGYHVRNLVNRPEYGAYIYLMRLHDKQGQIARAVEVGDRFVARYSQDGWLWPMHRQLADLYARAGRSAEAEAQRSLALTGLAAHQQTVEARDQRVGGSDRGTEYWQIQRQRIEAPKGEAKDDR